MITFHNLPNLERTMSYNNSCTLSPLQGVNALSNTSLWNNIFQEKHTAGRLILTAFLTESDIKRIQSERVLVECQKAPVSVV